MTNFRAQSMSKRERDRPSGVVLPLILRKRRKLEENASTTEEESKETTTSTDPSPSQLPSSIASSAALETHQISPEDSNSIFTAQEIQDRLWRTSVAMVEVQKQLHRGEESYHEDTHAHGNIFRGWDSFIDSRDIGPSGGHMTSSLGDGGSGRSGSRRMPADHRWFSGSCPSVGRNKKPVGTTPTTLTKVVSATKSSQAVPPTLVSSLPLRSDPKSEVLSSSRKADVTSVVGEVLDSAVSRQPSGNDAAHGASSMDVDPQEDKTPTCDAEETKESDVREEGIAGKFGEEELSRAPPTSTRRTTRKRKAGD